MKFAFTISCTGGYLFGMISAMNAMAEFGMTADWEVAYENVPEDYRKKVSNAFPFKVNWTSLLELTAKRNNVASRHFLASWMMTAKVIDDYDAICLIQADLMPLSNMNAIFNAVARADSVAVSEHYNTTPTIEDLYKADIPITGRHQCAFTDQIVFANKKYKSIFSENAKFMDIKAEGDKNHPVILLNNYVKKYVSFDNIIPLERHVWSFQHLISKMKLTRYGDYIYNDRKIRLRGIHNRWWQKGRAASEIRIANKLGCDMSIAKHNYNLIRDYMAEFNAKREEIMIHEYEKTIW